MGLKGNLTCGEILEQLVHANSRAPVRNIVFMGMGEPLNNYEQVGLPPAAAPGAAAGRASTCPLLLPCAAPCALRILARPMYGLAMASRTIHS
jgi:hypothetical protein